MNGKDVLVEMRKQSEMTQVQLADKMGYKDSASIRNIFNSKHGCRIDVFVKLARIMGYDVIVRRGKTEYIIEE